ncbi:Redoxin [Lenzites betulinus]|nr:Redoxin [Lenzites betulinus]
MVSIKVGDEIPLGKFIYVPYTPELADSSACGLPAKVSTDAWKGKKVLIFGLPGAFTPPCHGNHAPQYLAKVDELKAKGVDVIAVLSANDPFVLSGWSRILGFEDKILALSDFETEWSDKLGLTVDLSGAGIGLGKRTTRFALLLDDLKVKYIGVEEDPTQVTVSGVEPVLAAL